jgi:hypothetical protein
MMASTRKPGDRQKDAIKSGDLERLRKDLEQADLAKLSAMSYVKPLALIDSCEELEDSTKSKLRQIVYEHLSKKIDANDKSPPGNSPPSPELDLEKVHTVFMQQTLKGKYLLKVGRIRDLWRYQSNRLFDIQGLLKEVVNKGSPEILSLVLELARGLPEDRRLHLFEDTGRLERDGPALAFAISKVDVDSVKLLIKEHPHGLQFINRRLENDSALHTIIKTQIRERWNEELEEDAAKIEKAIKIINAIVKGGISTLWAHDSEGNPPYFYARKEKLRRIEKLLRDAVFEKLSDADLIRKSLYGSQGEKWVHYFPFSGQRF